MNCHSCVRQESLLENITLIGWVFFDLSFDKVYYLNMYKEITQQLKIIKQFSILGKSIEKDIEISANSLKGDDREFEKVLVYHAQAQYVNTFFKYINFLILKTKNDNLENMQFYIPLLRGLLEIYADLLYLSNEKLDNQVKICAAHHLFTLATHINRIRIDDINGIGLEKAYNDYYENLKCNLGNDFVSIFPNNSREFSGKRYAKYEFSFPKKDKIFESDYFSKNSKITAKIFNNVDGYSIYTSYKYFSGYVHGNFYNYIEHEGVNEQFWLISKMTLFSILMIELLNNKVVNKKRLKEFNEIIQDYKSSVPGYIERWKQFNSIKNCP
jgi:hypothetical protein